MSVTQTALSEALVARLCHDLAGLAGATSGMLELAADASGHEPDALPLAREAAAKLLGHVRVIRAAWGGVAQWQEDGLPALARGLGTEKLHIVLGPGIRARAQQAAIGRLLLNLVLLGSELLRGRGEILLHAQPDLAIRVTLAVPPPALAPDWPSLDAAELAEPRLFQRDWTALAARDCGCVLRPSGPTLQLLFPA